MRKRPVLGLAAVLAVAGLTVAACGSDSSDSSAATTAAPTTVTATTASMATKDIVDTAVAAGSFNTLATALKAAGLVDTLKGAGPFTVFAPTDDAFAKVPKATLDKLLADKAALTKVLTYHVLAGKVMAADVKPGQVTTVEGSPATITVDGSSVKINDANVVQTDVAASNGVIHVIDTVLLPRRDRSRPLSLDAQHSAIVADCDLCEAARITPWFHEDDLCWIAECEICAVADGGVARARPDPSPDVKRSLHERLAAVVRRPLRRSSTTSTTTCATSRTTTTPTPARRAASSATVSSASSPEPGTGTSGCRSNRCLGQGSGAPRARGSSPGASVPDSRYTSSLARVSSMSRLRIVSWPMRSSGPNAASSTALHRQPLGLVGEVRAGRCRGSSSRRRGAAARVTSPVTAAPTQRSSGSRSIRLCGSNQRPS